MMSEREDMSPWSTLARMAGPLLIWLSLSYLFLAFVVQTDFVRSAFGEDLDVSTDVLLISGAAAGLSGIAVTVWGLGSRRTESVPVSLPRSEGLCPTCGATLLKSTTICPYCGTSIAARHGEEGWKREDAP